MHKIMQELYCMTMVTHVYLVPTLKMCGAIPPLFYALWYGTYSSIRIIVPYVQKVICVGMQPIHYDGKRFEQVVQLGASLFLNSK